MAADDEQRFAPTDVAAVSGNENVLILAPRPGDETRLCGGFIAESCARGRPPYVVVLTDGAGAGSPSAQTQAAAACAAAVRAAAMALGLPEDRLLFIGLLEGTAPCDGPILEAAAKGLALVSWREDCNAICVPRPASADNDVASALAIAHLVAADQHLRLFCALDPDATAVAQASSATRLDVACHAGRIGRAQACLGAPPPPPRQFEIFAQEGDFRPNRG